MCILCAAGMNTTKYHTVPIRRVLRRYRVGPSAVVDLDGYTEVELHRGFATVRKLDRKLVTWKMRCTGESCPVCHGLKIAEGAFDATRIDKFAFM